MHNNIEIIAAYCTVATFVLQILSLLRKSRLIKRVVKNMLLKEIVFLTKIWVSIK